VEGWGVGWIGECERGELGEEKGKGGSVWGLVSWNTRGWGGAE